MKNLAAVPWLRGRDHNLYNGLAKVYPESRFLARREQRKESADPLVRSYGRCIIIALACPIPRCILFTMCPHTCCRESENRARCTFWTGHYSIARAEGTDGKK